MERELLANLIVSTVNWMLLLFVCYRFFCLGCDCFLEWLKKRLTNKES